MRHRSALLLIAAAALSLGGGLWVLLRSPDAARPAIVSTSLAPGGAGSGPALDPGDAGEPAPGERPAGGGRQGLASALGAEAAATADEPQVPRLVGRVVDAQGAPVPEAEVLLAGTGFWMSLPADLEEETAIAGQRQRRLARSDLEGRFAFASVEPGDYALAVRAPGFAPYDRARQRVPRHQVYELGDLELLRGVVVEGRAVDGSGAGVGGVRVLRAITSRGGSLRLDLPGVGAPLGETAEDGGFRADVLAPGAWHLLFDSPAHRLAELSGSTLPAGASERGLVVRLEPGLAITGRVEGVAAEADRPLRVSARAAREQPGGEQVLQDPERHRPRRGEVAPDGTFAVRGLAPGARYGLALERWEPAEEAGLAPADALPAGRWERLRSVDLVQAMAGARDVVLRQEGETSLALRAVDESTGAPVERFAVELNGEGLRGAGLLEQGGEPALAHPGGAARFEGLRPRGEGSPASLRIEAPGYEPFERGQLLVKPGEPLELGELRLRPAPRVRVRVVDDVSGEPIAGARVVAAKASEAESLERHLRADRERDLWADARVRGATSDAEGLALVTVWTDAVAVLRAAAPGHVASAEARAVPPHAEGAGLELRLPPAGAARVWVRDERGAPLSGIYVEKQAPDEDQGGNRFRWEPDAIARQTSDESGLVLFEELPPGSYLFRAREGGPQMVFRRGRGPDPEPTDDAPEARAEVRAGQTVELTLTLPERGGLRARLTQGGEPLVGALCGLREVGGGDPARDFVRPGSQDPRRAISDHEGRVVFDGLPAGRQELVVTHPSRRMSARFDVRVEPRPRELELELGLTGIEGTVRGASGGALAGLRVDVGGVGRGEEDALMDFRVSITQNEEGEADYDFDAVGEQRVRTDSQGAYELLGVRPDTELVVSVSGDHVVGASVQLAPLGRDELRRGVDFELEAAGCIRVELSGAPQGSRERYRVELRREGGRGQAGDRAAGSLQAWRRSSRFCSLRPGTWTVELWRGDDRANGTRETVELRAGEERQLSLQAP